MRLVGETMCLERIAKVSERRKPVLVQVLIDAIDAVIMLVIDDSVVVFFTQIFFYFLPESSQIDCKCFFSEGFRKVVQQVFGFMYYVETLRQQYVHGNLRTYTYIKYLRTYTKFTLTYHLLTSIGIRTVDIYRFRLFDHCSDNYLPSVCFMNLLYNLDIIFRQY